MNESSVAVFSNTNVCHLQETGATPGQTLSNNNGSSGKDDVVNGNLETKNGNQITTHQIKDRNVFSFDVISNQAPSIADITQTEESIAESIEIVGDDDEVETKGFYKEVSVTDARDEDDSDKTIENEVDDKLRVPKTLLPSDSIRRESQETVIFAPKGKIPDKIEKDEVQSDKGHKLKKTLSFQSSLQSDPTQHVKDTPQKHKKRKKKHKSSISSTESSLSSKSMDSNASELDGRRKSRHRHKDKHSKRGSRSKGCWYCKNSCEYHRERNMNLLDDNDVPKSYRSPKTVDEGTQAGPSCLPFNAGMQNRHYLFDPCADAFFDYPRNMNPDVVDSYKYDTKMEAAKIAKLYLTTNPGPTPTSLSHKKKESGFTVGASQNSNNNPMAFALSELLRGQLDLTANFLSSQKKLYATYCSNLDLIARHEAHSRSAKKTLGSESKIPEKKLRRSHNVIEGENETKKPLADEISIEEDVIVEEYESEFEEDDSEDNSLVEMKTNVETKP